MKRIVLVRHATATAREADGEDFDRSLRKKGRKEALELAGWYETVAEVPDLLLTSPANRALETALVFAKELGYSKKKIMVNEALYGSLHPQDFLKVLRAIDDKYDSVMIFGHEPSFSQFAQFAVQGFEQDMPKCGVLGFDVDSKVWRKVNPREGRLQFFEHPQKLREHKIEGKELRSTLSDRIQQNISAVLTEFGIEKKSGDEKKIQAASVKLAKTFATHARSEQVPSAKRK